MARFYTTTAEPSGGRGRHEAEAANLAARRLASVRDRDNWSEEDRDLLGFSLLLRRWRPPTAWFHPAPRRRDPWSPAAVSAWTEDYRVLWIVRRDDAPSFFLHFVGAGRGCACQPFQRRCGHAPAALRGQTPLKRPLLGPRARRICRLTRCALLPWGGAQSLVGSRTAPPAGADRTTTRSCGASKTLRPAVSSARGRGVSSVWRSRAAQVRRPAVAAPRPSNPALTPAPRSPRPAVL